MHDLCWAQQFCVFFVFVFVLYCFYFSGVKKSFHTNLINISQTLQKGQIPLQETPYVIFYIDYLHSVV